MLFSAPKQETQQLPSFLVFRAPNGAPFVPPQRPVQIQLLLTLVHSPPSKFENASTALCDSNQRGPSIQLMVGMHIVIPFCFLNVSSEVSFPLGRKELLRRFPEFLKRQATFPIHSHDRRFTLNQLPFLFVKQILSLDDTFLNYNLFTSLQPL